MDHISIASQAVEEATNHLKTKIQEVKHALADHLVTGVQTPPDHTALQLLEHPSVAAFCDAVTHSEAPIQEVVKLWGNPEYSAFPRWPGSTIESDMWTSCSNLSTATRLHRMVSALV
jgi:hypothetical protein